MLNAWHPQTGNRSVDAVKFIKQLQCFKLKKISTIVIPEHRLRKSPTKLFFIQH